MRREPGSKGDQGKEGGEPPFANWGGGGLSRRQLLQAAGAGGLMISAGGLLAACGSSGGGTTAATAGGGGGGGGGAGAGKAVAAELEKILGPFDPKTKGAGLKFPLGLSVPESGPGQTYAKPWIDGTQFAVAQIKEMGGPEFELIIGDHKTGDPQAGVQNMRSFHSAGASMALTSYTADLGAQLPLAKQYKMLLLDGGAGTGDAFQEEPYFWGTTCNPQVDTLPGLFEYISRQLPEVESIIFCQQDFGSGLNTSTRDALERECSKYKIDFQGSTLTQTGSTDFSNVLPKLQDADLIVVGIFAQDLGYFLKQFRESGNETPCVAFADTKDVTEIAGPAEDGLLISLDAFVPAEEPNPWAKLFTESFSEAYGEEPFASQANYYEDTFTAWALIRRVLEAGGDPASGEDLQKALEKSPTFPSVYGGTTTKLGTYGMDRKTHSVSDRQMGVYEKQGDETVGLATFNIDGRDFKLLS